MAALFCDVSGRPFAVFIHLFVQSDIVITIFHEWLEKSWSNLHRIATSHYWWSS